MDYKQLLIQAGLPCVSAIVSDITGEVIAQFERSLTPAEWNLYLKIINPPTWEDIRIERDQLLSACDWTQLLDTILTFDERIAWQTYRQALRDIPQLYTTPDSVIWPEKP